VSRLGLAARNLFRNKVRTSLTIAGVAVAILAFLLIQTAIAAWNIGVTTAAKDRLVSRHKVTFVLTLPKRYIEEVRQLKGVKDATWANWFGGKNPNAEKEFFQVLAVEPETYNIVYDELGLTPEEKKAWVSDRQGAIIGDVLASKFGWKIGDEVSLISPIYPGDWKFRIHAIYRPLRKSAYRDMFLFDWDYLNDNMNNPAQKDTIGWITARVNPGVSAAELSKVIDARFDVQDTQTLTQDEGAFNQSFMGMFSTVLNGLNIVSGVILGIMMLILGNTVAMGVRERTREYGVLRAVGFLPGHVRSLVLGESMVLGLLGGLAGILIAVPIIGAMGAFLEENMSVFFPVFRLGVPISLVAVGIAVVLGILAAAIPARSASRLKVVDALRHTA
jgi:putative ABC transport system permease protein